MRLPNGYNQYTSLASAILLSAGFTIPAFSTSVILIAEGADLRWRDDGIAPTASVGMPIAAGTAFVYNGDLAAIQFIQQATGAKLNASFCRGE